MTFTPNVPQATQTISGTQQAINNNFLCLENAVNGFTKDHVTMTDSTDGAAHKKLTFTGSVSPVPSAVGTYSYLYPNAVTNQELFFANAQDVVQMTDTSLDSTSGEGFIAGGVQVRAAIGDFASSALTSPTIPFSTAFPTACVAITVTGINSSTTQQTTYAVSSISTSGFVVTRTQPFGDTFYYVAMGY